MASKIVTKISQFRYYSDDNPKNYPSNLEQVNENTGERLSLWPTATMLSKYTIDKYTKLKRIIIQSLPGLRITLYSTTSDVEGVEYVIGPTGILDLDASVIHVALSGLTINSKSRNLLHEIKDSYFIMTIVYEAKEETE